MTTSDGGKVIVRVEVLIEGLGTPGKVTTSETVYPMALEPPRHSFTERASIRRTAIDPLSANVPVACVINGQSCMEASGTSLLVSGAFAQTVKAMAYSTPDFPPPANPPDNAATDLPAGNPNWSFTCAKGNAVPGGKFTPDLNGPVNSTLVVWYFYSGSGSPESESCNFHGYQADPGSVSGSGITPRGAERACLHATFTGALSSLGTVTLTWNGVSWAGISGLGGAVLSFVGHSGAFQLLSVGPRTAFIVAEHPRSFRPFAWTAAGVAHGALAGPFSVTILE
jgi:hypothetical protein